MDRDDRYFSAYYRTNRRTQWRYADYAGIWDSVERAIQEVSERVTSGEYMIQDIRTDKTITGTI